MISMLARSARTKGITSDRRASDSAANSTIAPCAKLNTPEALKISTKPSAISEYSMPAIRPPIRVSRNAPMASVRGSQVRGDHRRVVADLGRRPVADLLAVVEHDDAVAEVHHDAHVVLDE